MGSLDESEYSVPREAALLLDEEILQNDKIPTLPTEFKQAASHVRFTGNDKPSIPINWRFAESSAVLKAFEATMVNVLRARKYKVPFSDVVINTDHASLFSLTPILTRVVNPDGSDEPLGIGGATENLPKHGFPNADLHRCGVSNQRIYATNIHRTKDGRYYHLHGSMNPEPTLKALGLPTEAQEDDSADAVVKRIQERVAQIDSQDLDRLMNDQYKQAGTICRTPDEFRNSEHGRANAHVGLYSLGVTHYHGQPQSWWPDHPSLPSSAERPLASLKVIDLTRVIAAPSITRSLAELGASVMRVTCPTITDMSMLHPDLSWGKWNCSLDLKEPHDRHRLGELIKEADVVVEGYRPGVMEKHGFGREDIFNLVKDRDRGIIHVRENCYGWNGPWQHRSGWQQISDACCGVSMRYGQAMGNDEAVTPVFPNSDFCTGIAGSIAVLHALIRRAAEGGSFGVDTSLNYYSQWLTDSVGEYPKDTVWAELWKRHGSPVFRNYHSMHHTIPAMMGLLAQHDSKVLFNSDFFERRRSGAVDREFIELKPIAQYANEAVKLGYQVGTRGNGVDLPAWPEDLKTEVIK